MATVPLVACTAWRRREKELSSGAPACSSSASAVAGSAREYDLMGAIGATHSERKTMIFVPKEVGSSVVAGRSRPWGAIIIEKYASESLAATSARRAWSSCASTVAGSPADCDLMGAMCATHSERKTEIFVPLEVGSFLVAGRHRLWGPSSWRRLPSWPCLRRPGPTSS